ncbi:hypothetical protein ACSN7Q_000534 [Flavobacterium psychrophilum]
MTKLITTLLTVFITVAFSFGQISTTKIEPKIEQIDNSPYDSIENFLGKDVNKYIGQEFYLKGVAESSRKYGYSNFYTDYNKGKHYKCCDSYNSKYDELNGKYFRVIEIIKHPKASENAYLYEKKFYIKLEEKISKDIVYFEYNSQFQHEFPFVVVGFFEKQKKMSIGKVFIFADRTFGTTTTDINTGKTISTKTGQKWKCTNLTIEEKYYTVSLIVQNSIGENVWIDYDGVYGKYRKGMVYTNEEADNYIKKFGTITFNEILQGKVNIGMTKEMCRLSFGMPKSINETLTAEKKSEQWVYKDKYLYFDNGILTTIQ